MNKKIKLLVRRRVVVAEERVVVDGFRVLSDLRADRPDHFAVLARLAVAHRLYSADRETYARAPLVRCAADGSVEGIRFSNQTLEPLPLDEPELEVSLLQYCTV